MASTSKKDKKQQQMQVFVRVRPLNKQEGNTNVVEIHNTRELSVKTHGGFKRFMYDRVFGPESQQLDVYKLVAEPAVKEVMCGYNCTVLAYGQTGTGKTYTMAGGQATDMSNSTSMSWYEDVDSGIIPRTMAHMFDELRVHQLEFTVRVSYLELYNEEIFDLLSPIEDNTKLKLYDDSLKKGSVIVSGLTEVTVNTKSEVFQVLGKGSEKRKFASTLMNSQSSRSHTVFCITLHTKENAVGSDDVLKTGKLYLVDLAGSENIRQSGATDLRAREAVSINQSLLTLGRCITKLIEHSGHVPYRESKLTRLLQDSLGGRTKATLIATISPAACNIDETLNTLQYAFLAKGITNKPEINQRLSKKTLLKEYTEEIERLRKDLAATRVGKGVYLAEDNYESLLRSRDGYKDELTEKIGQVRVMQEQMKNRENIFKELQISLEVQEKVSEEKAIEIDTLTYKLQDQSKKMIDLKQDNELKQFLVENFSKTEEQLKSTAKELITVADTTTGETRKLHDKLDILTELSKHNNQACEQHINEFNAKIDGISNKLRDFHDYECNYRKYMVGTLLNLEKDFQHHESKTQKMAAELANLCGIVAKQKSNADLNAEETVVNFELAQCNIAQVIKTSQDTCLQKFDANVVQQIYTLYTHIQKQGEFLGDKLSNWKNMVDTNYTHVTEFVDTCKKLILESKEEAQKFIDQQIRMCAEIQRELETQVKANNSFQSAFAGQYFETLTSLNAMKNFTEQYSKTSSKQSEQRLREMSGLHDNLDDLRNLYTKKSDNTCIFVDQFADSLQRTKTQDHTAIEDANKKGSIISDTLKNFNKSANDVLLKHKDDAIASYGEIEEARDNEYKDIKKKVVENFTNQSSEIKQITKQLVEVKETLETDMEEIQKTVDNYTSAMRSTGVNHDIRCNEMDSTVGTALDNCREGFRRLYTNSLKEYKVTGETPQRKTYRYPRILPETQPEKLVEEWRQERLQHSTEELEDKENQENVEVCVLDEKDTNVSKNGVTTVAKNGDTTVANNGNTKRPIRLDLTKTDQVLNDDNN